MSSEVPEILPPESSPSPPPAAFHPGSAAVLVLVDNLWNLTEFAVPVLWILTIPLCFLTVFSVTYQIQRRWSRNPPRSALWKAAFLAILAAVPTSITGTPVGLALLAWAGIRHPWKR